MLGSMFEMPIEEKLSINLDGSFDIETRPWNIGLIVGPSGCGKTITMQEAFGVPEHLSWLSRSVIDDFPSHLSMESISRVCQSVGFSTIPAWLRPHHVLSNGEKFRVEVARRLLSTRMPILIDEFTSVVDRDVARVASHSIQKYIREENKQLVAASCHYDIIDWLQPDWILEPPSMKLTWRSLQSRPPITVSVSRVKYEAWKFFAPFHYMNPELNRAARCYGLFVQSTTPIGMGTRISNDEFSAQSERISSDLRTGSGLRIPSAGISDIRRDSPMVRVEGYTQTDGGSHTLDEYDGVESVVSQSGESRQAVAESSLQTTIREGRPTNGLRNRGGVSTSDETAELQNISRSTDSNDRLGRLSQNGGSATNGRIASFCGVLHRPHPRVNDICGFTRMVTLPDWQGIGLAMVLANTVGAAYRALGKRLHSYPNHPSWIRSYQRNSSWIQIKNSGEFSPRRGSTSTVGGFGGKRCAVFMFTGLPMNKEDAERLVHIND